MIKQKNGFTIVELLIVIVVIGILAAIVIVAYSGIQTRANRQKENTDLVQIQKMIVTAQQISGKPLKDINGSTYTWGGCAGKSAPLPDTDTCWTSYRTALTRIATAAGVTNGLASVYNGNPRTNLPYKIDENESENMTLNNGCNKDELSGTYYQLFLPLSRSDC